MRKRRLFLKRPKPRAQPPQPDLETESFIKSFIDFQPVIDKLEAVELLHETQMTLLNSLGLVPSKNSTYSEVLMVAQNALRHRAFYNAVQAFHINVTFHPFDLPSVLGLSAALEGLRRIDQSALVSFYCLVLDPSNSRNYERHSRLLALLGHKEAARLFQAHSLHLQSKERDSFKQ